MTNLPKISKDIKGSLQDFKLVADVVMHNIILLKMADELTRSLVCKPQVASVL